MTKDLLLKEVAERATDIIGAEGKKYSKKDIDAFLQAYADCVVDNLTDEKTEKIPLPGIGSFTAKHVGEKSGVSAINGQSWHKDAHDEVKFTVSKSVKTLA